MQDGAHFPVPEPSTGRVRRSRRLIVIATGGLAVGVAALLALDVGSGGTSRSQTPTVSFTPSAARAGQELPRPVVAGESTTAQATTTTQAGTTTVAPAPPATPVVPPAAALPATPAPPAPPASSTPPTPLVPGTSTQRVSSLKVSRSSASQFLPDGSPLPVLVVFNGGTITLAGTVPSAAAAARLQALAAANSKVSAQIVDNLVVDPGVPLSVGVRVIEMNALRFAEGSSDVTADYAPELTRVVNLMRAMPSVTALIIGHADQTGLTASNLQLSQDRATAVIDYLVSQGISPDRLSGRGVGDRDPLTSQAGDVALALNRRTEFVFYGLFVGLGS
jgi:outer membrane protein OmpA-like peptidoglycan-associated protein